MPHERLGPCLDTYPDPGRDFAPAPFAKPYLDFLIDCAEINVRHGVLEPPELSGVYRPQQSGRRNGKFGENRAEISPELEGAKAYRR